MAGGNDYLIQVKANQPKLLKRMKQITDEEQSVNVHTSEERSRGRKIKRKTEVYTNTGGFDQGWIELNRIIKQTRSGKREGGKFKEECYYISSRNSDSAEYFAGGIRSHWGIENRVHWVKDVIMKEDNCRIKSEEIVSNLSLFRSVILSLFRINDQPSLTKALEVYTNRLEKCMQLMYQQNIY